MTKRENWLERQWNSFLRVSLWLVSIGLMLASSGIDGAYLAKLMPPGVQWLGYVLNTMSDIASEVIMYWYGRLKQAGRKKLGLVLTVQIILTGYAWLFSWRQLVPIVAQLEPVGAPVYAGFMAAFIPVALIGIGYVQALLAGKVVVAKSQPANAKEEPTRLAFACPHPGCELTFATQAACNAHQKKHRARSNGHEPVEEPEEVAT